MNGTKEYVQNLQRVLKVNTGHINNRSTQAITSDSMFLGANNSTVNPDVTWTVAKSSAPAYTYTASSLLSAAS